MDSLIFGKGIFTFDGFITDLKLAKVIKETGLDPEELLLLKKTFEEARTLAKDDKLAIELEKAIADNDLTKIKNLLKGKSEKVKIKNEKINITDNLTSEIFNNSKKYFIDGSEVGSASIEVI